MSFSYIVSAYTAGILTAFVFFLLSVAVEKTELMLGRQKYKNMKLEKEILLAKAECRRELNYEKSYRA